MEIWTAPPLETRTAFRRERNELLALLDGLPVAAWEAQTPAGSWTVKDVCTHLLDGDLGRLSRDRDHDLTGLLPAGHPHPPLARGLALKNQRWVDAARPFSPRVICELLQLSTTLIDQWTAEIDILGHAHVSWASDESVPAWLDLAREFTETWVHHQQVRTGAGLVTDQTQLPLVLSTFVWAFPHQYRAQAPSGATVQIYLGANAPWHLVAGDGGRWTLEPGLVDAPDALLRFTADTGWRSLVGAPFTRDDVEIAGPSELINPLFDVRGIIA